MDVRKILKEKLDNGQINALSFLMANVQYTELLEKAEGSRGGRVIGHTKSGKPIYERYHKSFESFSAADHNDAHEAHKEAKQKAHDNKQDEPGNPQHDKDILLHKHQMKSHSELARVKAHKD